MSTTEKNTVKATAYATGAEAFAGLGNGRNEGDVIIAYFVAHPEQIADYNAAAKAAALKTATFDVGMYITAEKPEAFYSVKIGKNGNKSYSLQYLTARDYGFKLPDVLSKQMTGAVEGFCEWAIAHSITAEGVKKETISAFPRAKSVKILFDVRDGVADEYGINELKCIRFDREQFATFALSHIAKSRALTKHKIRPVFDDEIIETFRARYQVVSKALRIIYDY